MKLTKEKLKKLILETLEEESALEGLISSGEWENINQALSLTVEMGIMPLEELPWHLLSLDAMAAEDLMGLGQYLYDNDFVPDSGWSGSPSYYMHTGLLGMKKAPHPMNKGKSKWREWVERETAKVLGIKS